MKNLKKINVFQLNKLSKLHDGKNIFFTKTDYLMDDFKTIEQLNNDVILISGNSDYTITDFHRVRMPSNIKAWFATNVIVEHPKIIPIPLGIENFEPALRPEHGVGYDRGKTKESFFLNYIDKKPNEFIYSNFRCETNPHHRNSVINVCKNTEHIIWEEPTLTDVEFFTRILDFEAVFCPQGNGEGDNHRIYETLYLNRIPITTGPHVHKSLHHKFPVILIEDISLLKNYNFMREQIDIAKSKIWDKNLLDLDYWESKILSLM